MDLGTHSAPVITALLPFSLSAAKSFVKPSLPPSLLHRSLVPYPSLEVTCQSKSKSKSKSKFKSKSSPGSLAYWLPGRRAPTHSSWL